MSGITSELTLGSDPECFLYSPVTEEYISSVGKLGGTKECPLPVPHGAILEDNVTAEFNTEPVPWEEGSSAFANSIILVRDHLASVVENKGLELKFCSTATFSPMQLSSQAAQESGCDPDYNVYLGDYNEYPPLEDNPVRCSGGHIHIGHPIIHSNPRILGELVTALDASIGTTLMLLEGKTERVETYGALGNFRPKPYGVEYRTASNLWVSDEALMEFVHWAVRDCLVNVVSGRSYREEVSIIRKQIASDSIDLLGTPRLLSGKTYEYGRDRGWWK